jgi:hypothetical protein
MSVVLAQALDHPLAAGPAPTQLFDSGLPLLAVVEALKPHQRREPLGVEHGVHEVGQRAIIEYEPTTRLRLAR